MCYYTILCLLSSVCIIVLNDTRFVTKLVESFLFVSNLGVFSGSNKNGGTTSAPSSVSFRSMRPVPVSTPDLGPAGVNRYHDTPISGIRRPREHHWGRATESRLLLHRRPSARGSTSPRSSQTPCSGLSTLPNSGGQTSAVHGIPYILPGAPISSETFSHRRDSEVVVRVLDTIWTPLPFLGGCGVLLVFLAGTSPPKLVSDPASPERRPLRREPRWDDTTRPRPSRPKAGRGLEGAGGAARRAEGPTLGGPASPSTAPKWTVPSAGPRRPLPAPLPHAPESPSVASPPRTPRPCHIPTT